MELHFFHILKTSRTCLSSSMMRSTKNVVVWLSQFHYFVLISDRINKLSVRGLLDWLWWKFAPLVTRKIIYPRCCT
jgi:hypothetical protein